MKSGESGLGQKWYWSIRDTEVTMKCELMIFDNLKLENLKTGSRRDQ